MADQVRFDGGTVRAETVTRSHHRAQATVDALHASTQTGGKGSQRTRGNKRLVMTSRPELLMNARMVPVGVQVMVKMYDGRGEVKIDPDRRFVNPPWLVAVHGKNGHDRELRADAVTALWDALWDSVLEFPNAAGWRP